MEWWIKEKDNINIYLRKQCRLLLVPLVASWRLKVSITEDMAHCEHRIWMTQAKSNLK